MINHGTVCRGWQRGFPARERQKENEQKEKETEKLLIVFPVTHYLLRQLPPPASFLFFFPLSSFSPPHICFLGPCSCCYLVLRTYLISSQGKASVLECPGTRCSSTLCYSHLRDSVISLPKIEGIISMHTKHRLLQRKWLFYTNNHCFIMDGWFDLLHHILW